MYVKFRKIDRCDVHERAYLYAGNVLLVVSVPEHFR